MPTLSNDQHYTFIAEGRTSIDLVIDAGSMASVSIRRSVSEGSQQKYYESTTVTGIYPGDTVTIAAESCSVTYTVTNLSAVYATDPSGAVTGLVGPDGGEVQLPEPLEPTVIADWVSLAATGAVCGSPCLINRIRCVTGSAVTLTVYDNAAASSGTVLYTGSLSAGQEANISTPIRAINGVRAVFASGSFEFQIQQEAA